MTNTPVSAVQSITQGRRAQKSHDRPRLRAKRQAKEVSECVEARILCFLEQFRDEFAEVKDFDKAVKLLEKKGAVNSELFPYPPKRLSIVRNVIAELVANKSLKQDANKVPYLARDPEELHAQLVQQVIVHGMTSLKAQSIAHQRQLAQKAS